MDGSVGSADGHEQTPTIHRICVLRKPLRGSGELCPCACRSPPSERGMMRGKTAEPSWSRCVWLAYEAGDLTRAMKDVAAALHSFRCAGGTAWPSYATVAAKARCSVRSTCYAIRQLADLGLLVVLPRRVRAGWRSLRTSNRYAFRTPSAGESRVWPWRRARVTAVVKALASGTARNGCGQAEEARKSEASGRMTAVPPVRSVEEQLAALGYHGRTVPHRALTQPQVAQAPYQGQLLTKLRPSLRRSAVAGAPAQTADSWAEALLRRVAATAAGRRDGESGKRE